MLLVLCSVAGSRSFRRRTDEEDQTEQTQSVSTTKTNNLCNDISAGYTDGPKQPRLKIYPKTKFGCQQRSFNSAMFEKFPLLEYSVSGDAVFCFVCRHFPTRLGSQELVFVERGLRDWKNIDNKLAKHFGSLAHADAVAQWGAIQSSSSGGSVSAWLSEGLRKDISRNRRAVGTLVRAAVFCARQGISLRGHRESEGVRTSDNRRAETESGVDLSTNRGNFVEVIELLKAESDNVQQSLSNLPRNACYTSKASQEDFLKAAAGEVRRAIVSEIQHVGYQGTGSFASGQASGAGLFACIVDEARDNSCAEMMSICVRYVYDMHIHERFLGFVQLREMDAKTMATEIATFLGNCGLDIKRCIAQSYDGASVMSGRYNGVQKLIRDISQNPCPYVHCYAHRLNLILVDVAKNVKGVAHMFGLLEAIYSFQSVSTVRHGIFSDAQSDSDRILNIPQQSDTRWVCKYRGVQYFKKRYSSVLAALSSLAESANRKEAAEARGLLIQFKTFDVIFFLTVFDEVLSITNHLSTQLQSTQLDIGSCMRLIDAVIATLSNKRSERYFKDVYQEAVRFASANDVDISDQSTKRATRVPTALSDSIITSVIGRRAHYDSDRAAAIESASKSACAADAESEYVYRIRYYAIIDNFVSEMKTRFLENEDIMNAMCALEPRNPRLLSVELLTDLAAKYSTVLNLDLNELESQAKVAKNMFSAHKPESTMQMFTELVKLQCAFPDMLALFKTVITIPVSSASAERSFSTMRRIKTHLRASMSADRTSDLALLSVERELSGKILANPDKVIDAFASMAPRRMTLK